MCFREGMILMIMTAVILRDSGLNSNCDDEYAASDDMGITGTIDTLVILLVI